MKLLLGTFVLIALLVTFWSWNRAVPAQPEIGVNAPVRAAEAPPRATVLDLPVEALAGARSPAVTQDAAARRVTVASPFASLEVTVLDVDGAPLQGLTVVAAPRLDEATRAERSYTNVGIRFERTDASGKALLTDLQPREYEVSCQEAASSTTTVRERVVLAADERRALVLRFRPDVARLPCIAGTIVDERGAPLEGIRIRLCVDEGMKLSAWSDKEGRFEQTFPEGREIKVTVGGGPKDDDYEPSSLVVPFGTQSVRLGRVKTIPEIKLQLVCLDQATGERIQAEEWAISARRKTSPDEQLDLSSATGEFSVKDRPDWNISVFHPRVGMATGTFSDNLTRGPEGNTLTIRVSRPVRVTKDGFLIQER